MECSARSTPSLNEARLGSPKPAARTTRGENSAPAHTGNQARLRRLQAKLTVGSVDDPLEHEADAAADRVMRMADPKIYHSAPPAVSRKCEECEDEEKTGALQREAATGMTAGAAAAPASVASVLARS